MKLKKLTSLALAFVLAFTLVSCSSNETPESETIDNGTDAQYPIVIEHAFGETVIESKPERIVTIGWGNQDVPLALGVVPVGFSMANYGPVDELGMHSWTAAKVTELGEENPNVFQDIDGLDFEAISDAQPDVILAAYSGMTQEEYELLSQIAPVIPYAETAYATSWREQIIMNATGMGMKAEGEAYVAEMDTLITDTLAQYPQLEGKTGAFLWIGADDLSLFYVYLPVDPRAGYLTDLGIAFPEELEALRASDADFSLTVSAENIDVLNSLDVIVVYGDESLLETLQADPLFSTVPAIQNGAVVLLNSNEELAAATTPSALSLPAMVDEYVRRLAEAADKAA